ncbi:MAG: hypothetical protein HY901_12585, partial [Deltaproteobacteria bacterium]|nr:hypothetical protein [Deltaproteobacteria bacterium]
HDEAKVPELVKHLGESFWTSPAALRAAAAERGSAEIYRLPFLMRVVLRDARASPLAESALARRVRAEGSSCGRTWLATAEDSLLEALVAWREAEDGEEVHWRDAAMLLAVQGAGLEAEYVQAWAQRLELCDILREAQAQAGVGCALT